MTPTEQFLSLLEERQILSARAVANLRSQVAQSPTTISAESIAKRLVKHGHLTVAQAKRLLAAVEEASPTKKTTGGKPSSARPGKAKPAGNDEVELAPLDDEPAATKSKPARKHQAELPAAKTVEQMPSPARLAASSRDSLLDQEMPSFGVPTAGSLDGLMADAPTAAPGTSTAASSSGGKLWGLFRREPKTGKETESDKWGSPLMLLGGAGLLVMLIVGAWLWWNLNSGNAEKMFRAAEDSYNQGSYAEAKKRYEDYLMMFPKDGAASGARVKIEMAVLRQATLPGSDWAAALKAAEASLRKISSEKDFKDAYPELAAILPAIAEGLADTARKKSDAALVQKCEQALGMVEKYVPKTLRLATASRLADVQASLGITKREIARDGELAKTLAAMQKAIKQSKTADAYTACSSLLRQYPDLADNAKLKAQVLHVSRAQQSLVKWVAAAKSPSAAAAPAVATAAFSLARRDTKSEVPDVAGQTVLAAVDGAVYALDATTGKVLWRRFIGFENNPQAASLPIVPLSAEPGADSLVVDTARDELLRIDGASGNIRWRYAVGEPFDARPVVADEKIVLTTPTGKLITIAASTGESAGYVQLPQPVGVPPAVDGRRSLIYQIATHANVFVLSMADGSCRHVDFLGHERGAAATSPLLLDDFLMVAVNDGARDAHLRVYLIQPKDSGKSEPWLKLVQRIPLGGIVATPPTADGRRVLVTTTSGIVRVFETGGAESKSPLRQIAEYAIEGAADNLIRYPLLQTGQLWIADNRLTKYDVQAARGRLEPKWVEDEQSAFLQSPVAAGQAVIAVRKKLGTPGAVVTARAMTESDLLWSTQLGVPPAAEPQVLDDGKAIAITAGGAAFRLDAAQAPSVVLSDPLIQPDAFRLPPPVKHVIRLDGGWLAFSGGKGTKQIGVFDPKSATPLITWLRLPDDADTLACAPVAMGRGLLVATLAGQVCLLDPKTGDRLVEPFQPALEAGTRIEWLAPAVINDKEAVISDGKTKIYHLAIQATPKPHFASVAMATVDTRIVSPLAVLGETIYATDASKALLAFGLPKLAQGNKISLGGQFAWGPARVGDRLLLATDDNQLLALDATGKQLWQTPLLHGPLAGAPLLQGGNYLLASRGGTVSRVDAATGKQLAKVDVGCPLATGPAARGKNLLVGGYDGTIYELRQP